MTALYTTTYTTAVRQYLQTTGDDHWTDAEIVAHLTQTVREFSQVVPAENMDTGVSGVTDSYDLDISGLTDWHEIMRVEFPIGEDPPHFVNFNIWKDVLTMQQSSGAADSGVARIWWLGPHTVGASSSTIKKKHEPVIIEGCAAHCMRAWLHKGLDAIHATLARTTAINTAIGLITAQIALGRAQLVTADTNLDTNYPKIDTLITQIGTQITLLLSDIAASRAAVGANLALAVAAAGHISDPVASAVTDATGSLGRGEFYINRINVGGGVPDDWANYARAELATGSLYAQQAHAYIAADRGIVDKLQTSAGELNGVNAIRARIQAYDDYGNPNKHYGALASKYFEDAGAALIEVQGNIQAITANLQIANVVANYCRMADLKLEAWRRSLYIYRPYRIHKRYGLD